MTIETKHDIGSKHRVEVDSGRAAFVVSAITIRINSPRDIRIIYDGKLYQHGSDANGKLLKWAYERPYSFEESKLDHDDKKSAPSNGSRDMDAAVQ